jgi:Alw26I/Eco31I/Esp3I family type II restriction m6 adenine DNA methyltransferase
MPTRVASWRLAEAANQSLAARLHRAAAIDLANAPELWPGMPGDGLVRDLLQRRAAGMVPSVRLSSSAGQVALLATLVEMGERSGSSDLGWRGESLELSAEALAGWLPELGGAHLPALATVLPGLKRAAGSLAELDDPTLALLCGRVLESATSCYWIFTGEEEEPRRIWDPWHAKKQGCFFTPRFVARHIFTQARGPGARAVLDPAVGAGALLIEAFLALEGERGPEEALGALYGVDVDPALVAVSSMALAFLSGQWSDGRPATLGSRFVVADSLLLSLGGARSWSSLFPRAFDRGGFDAVVMNPPYGQLKVNRSSLPSRSDDDSAAAALRERALLQAREQAAETAKRLRAHPDYRHAHGGVPDLPRFFVERALSVLAPGGRMACIVPSTFMADHRSKGLRAHLLDEHRVRQIDLFPEDARMFPDVNQPTCVLVVEAGGRTGSVRLRRNVRTKADLRARPASVDRDLIRSIDPAGLRIPNCAAEDLEALRQMHAHPSLGDLDWIVNLRGEFDLTIHARYLREQGPGYPLVRGGQIERFRSDLDCVKQRWVAGEFLQDAVSDRKAAFMDRGRIVLRQCSYLSKPWRISAALAEAGAVVANSCNFLAVEGDPSGLMDEDEAPLFMLGVLNSPLVDWRFRLTSSTNHVGNYELASLPVPLPRTRRDALSVLTPVRRLLEDPASEDAEQRLDLAVRRLYGL